MLGVMYKTYWMIPIGAGFTMYGIVYFLVHEVIIHQRIKWFTRSNNTYIRALRWAQNAPQAYRKRRRRKFRHALG